MATDATIIVGKLDAKELENSIDELVNKVANKTQEMANKFEGAMDKMKSAVKDFAITQKVSVDLIKEAWRNMSSAFDAMVKAQEATTGGGPRGSSPAPNTIGALKEEIRLQSKKVDEQIRGTAEAQVEVDKHRELQRQLKEETKSTIQKRKENAKILLRDTFSMPTNQISSAEAKLRQLIAIASHYRGGGILDNTQWHRLQNEIDKTKKKIEQLKAAQPQSLKQVLGMDENSVDAIAKKMQALKHVKIDPNNANEVRKLGEEYQKLSRKQAELLGKGVQLTHSNNYLAQSFGYIRNRIVYALTLGAFTNFMKQLYDVRGEYELLERSLGILVDDMEKGTQVFNELNEMAIKSPFTLIELGTSAKQLAAYNFTAEELVDTTKRLADISSALGVPMERLVYNLGQIKAQGRLNARDARDFANAGLAIVPMLAQMYTEQKRFGEQQVTTAQVYDMITKKMVSYRDVLSVIYKVTDEGGKFFDFQAKQAGTLKVQIANLSLAFNNMLNDIGTQHQSALAAPLKLLRWLFANWRDVYKAIQLVIAAIGVFKAEAILTGIASSILSIKNAYVALKTSIMGAVSSQAAFNTAFQANKLTLIAGLIASLALGYSWLGDQVEETSSDVEDFGESGAKALSKVDTYLKILEAVDEKSSTYKKTIEQLNEILQEYGIQTIKEGESLDKINKKREKAIELIKEEGIQRQYANKMAEGNERYNAQVKAATEKMTSDLKNAMTRNFLGFMSDAPEIQENAEAISAIVGQIVESNIELIAGKTNAEYQKGISIIFAKIQEGMKHVIKDERLLTKQWLNDDLFMHDNIIQTYIDDIQEAKTANDNYANSVTSWFNAQQKANKSTMSLTERLKAYERALQKPTDDTFKLYDNIARLVKDYAKSHFIDFNVRFKADVPPAWMTAKDLPQLQALAKRFAALAQTYTSGTYVGGGKGDKGVFMSQEELWKKALLYAQAAKDKEDAAATDAAREAEEEKKRKKEEAKMKREQAAADRKARQEANKARQEQIQGENEVAKALKDEIALVKEMQSNYGQLRKAGFNNYDSINIAAMGYEDTVKRINNVLKKYGIAEFDAKDFAGKDVNQLLETLKLQKETLLASGKVKTESLKDIEKEIQKLNIESRTEYMKKIVDGLNSELSKLKDEYELAVELDANPELANVFQDMFGIDASGFPHTMDEYTRRAQEMFDTLRKASGYDMDLDILKASDDDWLRWANAVGISAEKLKEIKSQFKGVTDEAKKWTKDVAQKTKDLQYELADVNGKIAIEEDKKQKLIQQYMIETDEKQKALLELQIQRQQQVIDKLKEGLLELLPTYQAVFGGVAEHSAALTRKLAKQLKTMLETATQNSDGSYTVTDPKTGQKAPLSREAMGRNINKVNKELLKTSSVFYKLKEAFTKGEDGEIDYVKGIELIGDELKKLGELVSTIGDISAALGLDEKSAENVSDVAKTLEGLGQAAEGYVQMKSGDIIGGATNIVKGLWTSISTWFDNTNNEITREFEKSEMAVKQLQLAYKDLEDAVEDAYGVAIIGAKQAAAANKKLELAELNRQLRLEKSRDSKNRDKNKIIELQGAIKDLEKEIKTASEEIVNDLLGISSVGDAAQSFMDAYIEALRSGEDAMSGFNESVNEMIANLIKKIFVTRVIGPQLEKIIDEWQRKLEARSGKEAELYANAQKQVSYYDSKTDEELADELTKQKYGEAWRLFAGDEAKEYYHNLLSGGLAALRKAATEDLEKAGKDLDAATQPSKDDVATLVEQLRSISPILADQTEEIVSWLREFGLMKSDAKDKTLSALQQGIQGITEETAGALEAYMNSVSQQVYLQSDILTQIRDAVVTIDADATLATQAEILLQLQNTYVLMQSMHSLMNGWTTPSGQGIRVELV